MNVFGVPGKVRGPIEDIDIDATEIHLDWEIPDDTGGSDITGYVIEKKLSTMDKFSLVTASCSRSQFRVKKLEEKAEYVFRICAENKYGLGPWLESPPFTCRSKYRRPTAPSSPQFYEVTANTMTMIWNPPQSTGGIELTGYYIEKRERNAILWTKVNKRPIKDPEHRCTGLLEGLEYQFRVYCENKVGVSAISDPSKFQRAFDQVSEPQDLEVVDINRDSVSLKWKEPKFNGGANITSYNVEKRSGLDNRWYRANFTSITEMEYTVTALTPGEDYQFRIVARNALGTMSKPSTPTDKIIPHDEFVAPQILFEKELLDGVFTRNGKTIVLKARVTGKPYPRI